MQLFDVLNMRLFKPLAGHNRQLYADLLMLIWDRCRTATDYGVSKGELIRMTEDFLEGAGNEIETLSVADLDEDEEQETGKDLHSQAVWCIAQLRKCGWVEDLETGYEEDVRTAIRPQVVSILQAFYSIVHPQTVTYSGKLNKAYQLLAGIAAEKAPYENILKEVASATEELNAALRNLNASIGSFIDQMTQHKTPQEVLDLFEKYEEEIVVAAYQRFKTSDNLFNYRETLLERLDDCQDQYLEALAADYCKVEQCKKEEAVGAIIRLVDRIKDDLVLMGELIMEIDKNHITYRQRAVQRAQFMLLTDGTTQGRINSLLRYYAQTLEDTASLFDIDESPLSRMWHIYPVAVLGKSFLKPPVTSRKPTPIEPIGQPNAVDEEELRTAQEALLAYARSAVTMENVNVYAQKVLQTKTAVRASSLADSVGDDFVKIIALHTYSRSENRNYEIELRDQWISMHGFRFQEFVVKRKV